MEDFLNGNLDEMIDNLIAADRAEKLKGLRGKSKALMVLVRILILF